MKFWKTEIILAVVLLGSFPVNADRGAPARRKPITSALGKADLAANVPADCAADPICRALMVRARAFSLANHHTQALDAYQGAYALHPSAVLLINIGRLQYKLGRPHEAATSLRRALAQTPETEIEKRERVQRFLKEAEQAAASTPPPGTTIVTVSVPSPAPKEKVQLHRRWQLWTAVGGVAAAGTAALVIGLLAPRRFDPSDHEVYVLRPALTLR